MPYPGKTSAARILAVASAEVEAHGLDALSMRGLAHALGLAPNALYRYFPSREALVAALADRATAELLDALAGAAAAAPRAARLRAVGAAYLAFARARPRLYPLVVMPEQAPTDPAAEPAHARLWSFVLGGLDGIVPARDRAAAGVALWSYLHGLVALDQAGLIGDLKPDAGLWGFEAMVRGLTARPLRRT